MPESKTIQRDLLGNPIETKIPRRIQPFSEGQSTLDSLIEAFNNPSIDISVVQQSDISVNRRELKRKPVEYLFINRGTQDEIRLAGHYYTPNIGKEAWSAPWERRDSYPKVKVEDGDVVFQIKDSDLWENGIRWTSVIVLNRTQKGEKPRIKGHGYMRWVDIRKK